MAELSFGPEAGSNSSVFDLWSIEPLNVQWFELREELTPYLH